MSIGNQTPNPPLPASSVPAGSYVSSVMPVRAGAGADSRSYNQVTVVTPVGNPPTSFRTSVFLQDAQQARAAAGGGGQRGSGSTPSTTQLRPQYQLVGTSNDGGNTYQYTQNTPANVRSSLASNGNIATNSRTQADSATSRAGTTRADGTSAPALSEAERRNAGLRPGRAAANNPAQQQGSTPAATDPAAEEKRRLGEADQTGQRLSAGSYGNLKYPKTLNLNASDVIKFEMLRYVARGSGSGTTPPTNGGTSTPPVSSPGTFGVITSERRAGARQVLGSVVLPIPAGISDSNTVDWGDQRMELEDTALNAFTSEFVQTGSVENTTEATGNALQNNAEAKTVVADRIVKAITGNGLLQREQGAIGNNNLELLFNGPSLRSFSFTFRLSPRNGQEAEEVMKIIRFFKQGMSAKTSGGALLIKSPNTFRLAYMRKGQPHKYLNEFKEAALTSCNVNYTPDGNYMTFHSASNNYDGAMTSYELTLQFTELEPIFDVDYGTTSNKIGY